MDPCFRKTTKPMKPVAGVKRSKLLQALNGEIRKECTVSKTIQEPGPSSAAANTSSGPSAAANTSKPLPVSKISPEPGSSTSIVKNIQEPGPSSSAANTLKPRPPSSPSSSSSSSSSFDSLSSSSSSSSSTSSPRKQRNMSPLSMLLSPLIVSLLSPIKSPEKPSPPKDKPSPLKNKSSPNKDKSSPKPQTPNLTLPNLNPSSNQITNIDSPEITIPLPPPKSLPAAPAVVRKLFAKPESSKESLPSQKTPSEKMQKLMAKRRAAFKIKSQCTYVFQKGVKKGERCEKSCFSDTNVCSLHTKGKSRMVPAQPKIVNNNPVTENPPSFERSRPSIIVKTQAQEKSCLSDPAPSTSRVVVINKILPSQPRTSGFARPCRPPQIIAKKTRINRLPKNKKLEILMMTPVVKSF
ncbi:uncharacterized protein LOC128982005 [Macrosteles quadrilineatus]|uniref:uncharacterized protein LOC128982005 n=1 Tax=Macrosteles quadrilineatus TaxID=74068 RepID=UPI0023E17F63|nr:uncharacterized protein LOC128982005 [Macrosteles quadrilineatus]